MPLTLAIVPGSTGASGIGGMSMNFVASVTNSGSSSVTLQSLAAYLEAGVAAQVGQPQYLTPNVPVGVGNPTLAAGATASYPFSVTFFSPVTSGPSPQAPGGASGSSPLPIDSAYALTLQSLSSDGTVASVSSQMPIASALPPFPVAQGGALQFASGFNLVNFLTSFA